MAAFLTENWPGAANNDIVSGTAQNNTWTYQTGNTGVFVDDGAGLVKSNSSSRGHALASGVTPPSANYLLTFPFKTVGAPSSSDFLGVVLRGNTADSQCYVAAFSSSFNATGAWGIFRFPTAGGGPTQIGTYGPFVLGSNYTGTMIVAIQTVGSNYVIKVFGSTTANTGLVPQLVATAVVSGTDTTLAGPGFVGLHGAGVGGTLKIGQLVAQPLVTAGTLSVSSTGSNSAVLSFTGATDGLGPYSYQLQRSAHGANTWTNDNSPGSLLTFQSGSATFNVVGLASGTAEDFQVVCTDALGYASTSALATATTTGVAGLALANTQAGYASLALPYVLPAGEPLQITATGTGTSWSSPTGLFTVSGGTSPSIASIAVGSTTSATFTLNPGQAAGTITITDTSTGATWQFTVEAMDKFVFQGDSLMRGFNSGYEGLATVNGTNIPGYVLGNCWDPNVTSRHCYAVGNQGVNGQPINTYSGNTAGQYLLQASVQTAIAAQYNPYALSNVLFVLAGINDLRLQQASFGGSGVNAATVWADFKTFCADVHGYGFKVIGLSLRQVNGANYGNPTINNAVDTFNASFRSGWKGVVDMIVDTGANALLNTWTNATYTSGDWVHWQPLGYQFVGAESVSAVRELLVGAGTGGTPPGLFSVRPPAPPFAY